MKSIILMSVLVLSSLPVSAGSTWYSCSNSDGSLKIDTSRIILNGQSKNHENYSFDMSNSYKLANGKSANFDSSSRVEIDEIEEGGDACADMNGEMTGHGPGGGSSIFAIKLKTETDTYNLICSDSYAYSGNCYFE